MESAFHADSSPLRSTRSVDSGSDGDSSLSVSGPDTPESGKRAWFNSGVVPDVAKNPVLLRGHPGPGVRFSWSQTGKTFGYWFSEAVLAFQ